MHFDVSMGIYVYDERALAHLPDGPCQFPELVLRLLDAGSAWPPTAARPSGSTSGRSPSSSARRRPCGSARSASTCRTASRPARVTRLTREGRPIGRPSGKAYGVAAAGIYLTSTEPPASSISAFSLSASSRSMPSLMGFGASSTSALASLRPRPVAARTTLMTWIFLSPAAVRTTSNAVCSSSASAASPPPPAPPAGRRGDRRRGDAERLLERLDALGELEHGDALELLDPLLGGGGHVLVLLGLSLVGGRVRIGTRLLGRGRGPAVRVRRGLGLGGGRLGLRLGGRAPPPRGRARGRRRPRGPLGHLPAADARGRRSRPPIALARPVSGEATMPTRRP